MTDIIHKYQEKNKNNSRRFSIPFRSVWGPASLPGLDVGTPSPGACLLVPDLSSRPFSSGWQETSRPSPVVGERRWGPSQVGLQRTEPRQPAGGQRPLGGVPPAAWGPCGRGAAPSARVVAGDLGLLPSRLVTGLSPEQPLQGVCVPLPLGGRSPTGPSFLSGLPLSPALPPSSVWTVWLLQASSSCLGLSR